MEMPSNFEEFDKKNNFARRRSLLPWWIKIFIWFFIFGGVIAVLILGFGYFLNDTNLSIYGLETTQPYSITGFIILFLLIFKGIVAYGLWFEERWAPKAAIADAVLGIIICGIAMFILPFVADSKHFTIRFELVLLIPYLTKIQKVQKTWENI
ncbi:hypothetical protein CRN76_08860 [Chryseobacterium indologenes]|uniref:hypothetical protein n=1 Tax=Chryseobacterium indologenes TaxID=253 RepID=UPI000BFEA8AC|nr:hypothetical protein [Chryseobacterium indologenes]ATN05507.1 hypothetical protein CRN76_08860 [Chryseobacterium indologenes]AYY85733.1 hypothetical protein EGX91_14875 [Chryseobacterium indologenes]QIX82636.1 hypothetical protein FOB56_15945 [Chryseobacterium indologenes]UDQ52290.1 hypothetical protein LJF28_12715 [Chryseobacterium indologenes]HAO29607.1 hypothetical protein [Chryseobacterium indologenes]